MGMAQAFALPNVCPGHCALGLIARLEGREAVFEILEAIDELGVTVDVDKDAWSGDPLRYVERLVGVAQGVELASETNAEIFCGDDSRHG